MEHGAVVEETWIANALLHIIRMKLQTLHSYEMIGRVSYPVQVNIARLENLYT